jgi:hypothetical protein
VIVAAAVANREFGRFPVPAERDELGDAAGGGGLHAIIFAVAGCDGIGRLPHWR